MTFRKGDSLYLCDDKCELCEGKACIVIGLESIFDNKRMELVDRDIKKPCPNAVESDELI